MPSSMQLSDMAEAPNLVSLFLKRANMLGEKPFLRTKQDGGWAALTWNETARQVCLVAEHLRNLGLKAGDRVMIVSENRPEWCIADLAVMAAGCVTVPAYTTNTTRDHLHVLQNAGARAVIVSSAKLAAALLPAVVQSDLCQHVISFEPLRVGQGSFTLHNWEDFLVGDQALARDAVDRRVALIGRRDLACIIYTSGTGGAPRGVRQHHGMILTNMAGTVRVIDEDFGWNENEAMLSFLPLSHAYEHTAGQFVPIGLGGQIFYAESLEKLAANIEETRPTLMVVVPRLFEVLRMRIIKQGEKQGGAAAWLMRKAVALAGRNANGQRKFGDHALDMLLSATLKPKIRAKFGGQLKALVSGGAPLNPEIGSFFDTIGITLLQGYGQTEAGPVISCNRPGAGIAMDTVGPPLPGVKVQIAPDGEILVAGELVMHGYWDNQPATEAVLIDNWLHTGDIGEFDARGRIRITDRKKDMIVNDKGDNVSPQKVESMLTLQPEIGQAMVTGDQRPYIVGLIVPDAEWSREWAIAHNSDISALSQNADYNSELRRAVDRVNVDLSVIEKVRRFTIADEPFAIENEEMTPSLKIRRHKIKARYGARLDALYR